MRNRHMARLLAACLAWLLAWGAVPAVGALAAEPEEDTISEVPAEQPLLTDPTGLPAANPYAELRVQDVQEITICNDYNTVSIADPARAAQVLAWLQALSMEEAIPHVVVRGEDEVPPTILLGSGRMDFALGWDSIVLSGPGLNEPLIFYYTYGSALLLSGNTVLRVVEPRVDEPQYWHNRVGEFMVDQEVRYSWSDWSTDQSWSGRIQVPTELRARVGAQDWMRCENDAKADAILAQLRNLTLVYTRDCAPDDVIAREGAMAAELFVYRYQADDVETGVCFPRDDVCSIHVWRGAYYMIFSHFGPSEAFLLDPDEAHALLEALATLGDPVQETHAQGQAGNAAGQPGVSWYMAWLPALPAAG